MKKFKSLALFIVISLFAFTQAKAVSGPIGLVVWPVKIAGPINIVVIWPIVQSGCKNTSALMAVSPFPTDYSSGSNIYSITITNGAGFNYTVAQDNISSNVDFSNWPLGNYTGVVTFSDGDYNPISFTISSK